MNKQWSIAVVIGLFTVVGSAWAADTPGNGNAIAKTAAAPAVDYAAVVAKSLSAMDSRDAAAEKELSALVKKTAGMPNQHDIVVALVAGLTGKHKVETRRQICSLLSQFAGEKEAVAALDKTMDKSDLAEAALAALVRIPDMSATRALLDRIKKGKESARIAIITALGQKADASVVPALLEQTASKAEAIRKAAWHALAQIADTKAVQPFIAAVGDKKDATATAELLGFVDVLLRAGMLADADKLMKLRMQAGPLDTAEKCKMLLAHGRLGTPESISLVLAGLEDKDAVLRKAALEAAAILPSTDFTNEVTQKMNAAKGRAKLDLLEVLGKRGRQFDDRTVMLMYMAMLDKDETVRVACIRAMKAAGITATSPTLINMVRGQPGAVADAAEDALIHIPGGMITQQIADALSPSQPAAKIRLLRVLRLRGDKSTVSTMNAVNAMAGDTDVNVRAAAFEALVALSGENAYDTLLAAFDRGPGPDRDAAEKAMMSLSGDAITAKLLSGYFEAAEERKPSILRVLAPRQLGAIEALLQNEATSANERIREVATAGLAQRAKNAGKAAPVPSKHK